MLRPPRARGPNSMRPCIHPTTFSWLSRQAARVTSSSYPRRCVHSTDGVQVARDFFVGKRRAEITALHRVVSVARSRVVQDFVVDEKRDADGASGIPGRRLNPDLLERTFAEQTAVPDAVERDSTRQAQIFRARFLVHVASHSQHDLFGDLLNGCGQVHFSLGQL